MVPRYNPSTAPSSKAPGRKPRAVATSIVIVAIWGCAGVPDVEHPAVEFDVPQEYTAIEQEGLAPADTVSLHWWESFEDPHLNVAVEEALANNPNLVAAVARVEAAAARAGITKSELYPWLDLGVGASRRKQNFIGFPVPGSPDGTVQSTTASTAILDLGASWEIDLWGRIGKAAGADKADQQAFAADFWGAQLSIAAQTAKAWYGVVEARRQLELARETVRTYDTTVSAVRTRFERGIRPALDLRLSMADQATAKALFDLRERQLDIAQRRLEIIMGRYPAANVDTASELPELLAPLPAGLPAELVSRRPDLIAAERRLAASGARVSSAKRAMLPRISLTGATGTQSSALGNLLSGNFGVWSLAGNLLQPIFQGGRLRAQVDQAQSIEKEQLANYANTALDAFAEVEISLASEATLKRREENLIVAAEQSIAAYRLADDRYRSGLTDLITLLESQRRAVEAESRRIEIRRLRLENRIDLVVALGGGFGPQVPSTDLPEDEEEQASRTRPDRALTNVATTVPLSPTTQADEVVEDTP